MFRFRLNHRAFRYDGYREKLYRKLANIRQASSQNYTSSNADVSVSTEPTTTEISPTPQTQRRRLDVAIVGLPNAGKSQLLNVFTESTVAAVSRKKHTTREGILGARTVDNTQLVFVDTPGFLRVSQARQEGLEQGLMASAVAEMKNVDHTLVVVDAARRLSDDVRESIIQLIMEALKAKGRIEMPIVDFDEREDQDAETDYEADKEGDNLNAWEQSSLAGQKCSVVLNKVDLVHPKSDLIDTAFEIGSLAEECIKFQIQSTKDSPLSETELTKVEEGLPTFFYVSALKNDGVDDVLQFLVNKATPSKEWEVEAGEVTSLSPEERVEEVIREKIYRCLHKEVPHSVKQKNRMFRAVKDQQGELGLLVHQDLIVRSKSHQELVHGSGGRTLSRIRDTAEAELTKMFRCKVVLQLHVKLLSSRQRKWSV